MRDPCARRACATQFTRARVHIANRCVKFARSPIITEGLHMKLSARNQIPARVVSVNNGAAIANVELDANGVRLMASITVEAVRELGITEGSQVTAVIKASDVIVGAPD